ncbi:MAG: aminopeptidase P family protein [Armatimonadetes bacterium]|nr:aminopeptidase P family protein [Armatimonadota bacterium]
MPFVPAEVFADRQRRVREFLAEGDYRALLVTDPDHFYMLTGFHLDVAPWERSVAAVIPAEGGPFLVMNELSTHHLLMARERGSLHVSNYALYVEHPRAVNRTYTRDRWLQLLAAKLREWGGFRRGRLAADRISAFRGLRAQLPGLSEFGSASRFLVEMRQVKYPQELEIMRLGAALTDWGQDRYMETVRPGMLVTELDLEIARRTSVEGAARFPQDRLEVRVWSLSGAASASPHGTGADCGARFEKGDGVVNIIIVRLSGLVVENERTLFLGEPRSDIQRRAYTAATEANQAAIEKFVAGTPVAEADAAAQRVIEQRGFGDHIMHRTGHGMGIAGHEFPEDMAFNYRPLVENEVYSCEPGVYIYGVGGFRQDDTVVVGREQPEVITKRSKRLEDQVVQV